MQEPVTQDKPVGLPVMTFSPEQIALIKATVARGTTDDEFALFLYVAKHTGLNPLLRQIHAVKRWDSKLEREAMAIQVGIDGYRLIAERTKRYVPGPEPTFAYTEDGKLLSATAHIKKFVEGEWHTVSATAFYKEYVQTKKDGTPNSMWAKGEHFMLAKCAETLAIRKAFPSETAGTQGEEEMGQADNPAPGAEAKPPIQQPKPKELPKPESQEQPEAKYAEGLVEKIDSKSIAKEGRKPWNSLKVTLDSGFVGECPDFTPAGKVLLDAHKSGFAVMVGYTSDPKYGNKVGSAAALAGDAQEPE